MPKTLRPQTIILLLVWPLYCNDLYIIPLQGNQQSIGWWGIDLIFRCLVPLATLWYLFKNNHVTRAEAGLAQRASFSQILAGALLAGVLFIVSRRIVEPWLWDLLPYGEFFSGYTLPDQTLYAFLILLYFVTVTGVLEEIVYRAVVTSQLEKMIPSKTAVIICSCLIFAGIHWSEGLAKVVFSFLFALPLTLWYLKTRKIWGMIVCHALYDFLQFSL